MKSKESWRGRARKESEGNEVQVVTYQRWEVTKKRIRSHEGSASLFLVSLKTPSRVQPLCCPALPKAED